MIYQRPRRLSNFPLDLRNIINQQLKKEREALQDQNPTLRRLEQKQIQMNQSLPSQLPQEPSDQPQESESQVTPLPQESPSFDANESLPPIKPSPIDAPTLQRLSYQIVRTSSFDEKHPPSNLLLNDATLALGWRTQRFCVYPQELQLEFVNQNSPILLKEITITSHESMIASRVEISCIVLEKPSQVYAPIRKQKSLGKIHLSDNSQTNHQCREQKTVFVDLVCLGLKLKFFRNHPLAKLNPFQQIAVHGLELKGVILGAATPAGEFIVHPLHSIVPMSVVRVSQGVIDRSKLDPKIIECIDSLQSQKETAVKAENFDLAKQIKEVFDKLMMAVKQISDLESEKRLQVMRENYDQAKSLKYKIDKLKTALIDSFSRPLETEDVSTPHFRGKIGEGGFLSSVAGSVEQTVEELKGDFGQMQGEHFTRELESAYQQLEEEEEKLEGSDEKSEPQSLTYDEQVIPALRIKAQQVSFATATEEVVKEQVQGSKAKEELEELTGQKKAQSEPLQGHLPGKMLQKLFSSQWQWREEGGRELRGAIGDLVKKGEGGIGAALIATNFLIRDKISQVATKALDVMEEILRRVGDHKFSQSLLEPIMVMVIEEAAESRIKKTREQAERLIQQILTHRATDPGAEIQFLLRARSYISKSHMQSVKQITFRLKLMSWIVGRSEFKSVMNPSLIKSIADMSGEKMGHGQIEVRKAAKELLICVYKKYEFKRIEATIRNLPPRTQALLKTDIKEIEYMQ